MFFTRDKSFYKSVLFLAIPMILQNLITFSVGLADNMMIGTLGDSAVSGVYLGTQIQTILQILSAGIQAGILLISAQYWGKRDTESIKKIISIGLKFSLSIGFVFTLVLAIFPHSVLSIFTNEETAIINGMQYLKYVCYSYIFFCLTQSLIVAMRSVESAKIGMLVSMSSLFIDIVLNYVLIFGKLGIPSLGVEGTAIATLIARISETIIILVYVLFIDKKLHFSFTYLKYTDKLLLKDFIKYGTPLLMGQLVWGANMTGNSIILGHFSESVITATSLANTMHSMLYVAMNGFAAAVGIIIGKTIGANDLKRIKEYSRTVQVFFIVLGLFTGLMFTLLKNPFISFYNISDEAIVYTKQFINVISVTSIGTCYQCGSLLGLVKSGGDVSFVFKNDTIFVFLVVLPSAIITSLLGCPPWVVFACLKCDQILKCIVAFFKIRTYNWMKKLTRE